MMNDDTKQVLAYVIGCALGDGNLSRPNGRATRLRITCDERYPRQANEMISALKFLLPKNKVSIVTRRNEACFDISVYSNRLDEWMPWKVGIGSKATQGASVPAWILLNPMFISPCLKGLIQTDGCIYTDRGYKMINFVNNSLPLAEAVRNMLQTLGFNPRFNTLPLAYGATKYTVKVARGEEVERLINTLKLYKE